MTDSPVVGVDSRPFIEVTNHEYDKSVQWTKTLQYAGFASIAIVGVKFASSIKFSVDPAMFSYLSGGLDHLSETPWYEVRGHKLDAAGKIDATIGDFFLEGVKRAEEVGGGIGRTFGAFGLLTRHMLDSPDSVLRIPASALDGAESHFESFLGRKLSPEEKVWGFQRSAFTEADLEQYVRSRAASLQITLDDTEVAEEVKRLISSGEATPGKMPGLFKMGPQDTVGELVSPNVHLGVRRWSPKQDVINPVTGMPKHQEIIRDMDILTELSGGRPVAHTNQHPYLPYKTPERLQLAGASRDFVSNFVAPSKVDDLINKVATPRTKEAFLEGSVMAKKMSERYLRMMDQPLEALEDLIGKGRLLDSAKDSKGYQFLKNIFGTGGDYSGTAMDLWARHAKRIAPIALGLMGAYEVGSRITEAVSDKSLAQVGGSAIGAGQRLLTKLSDITGLTSLNKYQEREAEGSHRLLGVAAFPFAGYLGGRVVASMANPVLAEPGKMAWTAAREETHQLPKFIQSIGEKIPFLGDMKAPMTRGMKFGITGAVIGGALSAPFLLGSLGSNQSYDELVAEQRGETEVAVKKGRFWEMGRTDWEGEQTQYYRPGWFARMNDAPTDELQFGDYADRPVTRMVKGLIDPYWREKESYYERPYPITGPDTTSFGPLGTLWGATIGRVLKPPKIMHEDEISTGGRQGVSSGEVIQFGRNVSEAPSDSLGGLGPPTATSPYSTGFLGGEMAYKATEAAGLPGFVASSVKKAITGTQDFGVDQPVLASAADVGSIRDRFWDMNIGGGFLTTEAFRRFAPAERFELQKVNPVKNEMPSWMPGLNNFIDFTHGDPYSAIPEGEYRLPGTGYASRFKELEGVNPEDYPDIHKYKILGDIAPFSSEFKDVSKKMDQLASNNKMSEQDRMLYDSTKYQIEEKKRKVDFRDEPKGIIGNYWAGLVKAGRMNPVEHLLPISPIHKFAGPTDAITEYEDRNLYSTRSPSWDSPIDDFIKPALNNAAHSLGFEGIPRDVQEKRDLTEYFDKVEYMKNKRLEANARGQGQGRAAYAFARKAEYTMYGADPYADLETVKRVLPKDEAPFFEEFLSKTDPEEKGRILEMVPTYTKKFYTAQWQKQIYASLAAKGNLNSDERQAITAIESARATEGQAASTADWNDYIGAVKSGNIRENTFPDYIRAKNLEPYFREASPLAAPQADWIGYDPSVSVNDVKLKVVQNLGKDFHDFNLWESDVSSAARKPYLDDAANPLLNESPNIIREDILQSLTSIKMNDLSVDIAPNTGTKNRIVLDAKTDRRPEIDRELKRAGLRRDY